MDQMVVKTEGIIGADCFLDIRDLPIEVLVDMRAVMIYHHNHPAGLGRFSSR